LKPYEEPLFLSKRYSINVCFWMRIPLPGLYAIIAIPVSTILTLTAVEIVRKFGAATFTQLVSGVLSTFLPGGPPPSESRLLTTIIGVVYNIPGDFLLYWSFITFLGWAYSLFFFLYGFMIIHMILGGLAGMFTPDIIRRIKPVLSE